jgi:hypothetical protein
MATDDETGVRSRYEVADFPCSKNGKQHECRAVCTVMALLHTRYLFFSFPLVPSQLRHLFLVCQIVGCWFHLDLVAGEDAGWNSRPPITIALSNPSTILSAHAVTLMPCLSFLFPSRSGIMAGMGMGGSFRHHLGTITPLDVVRGQTRTHCLHTWKQGVATTTTTTAAGSKDRAFLYLGIEPPKTAPRAGKQNMKLSRHKLANAH